MGAEERQEGCWDLLFIRADPRDPRSNGIPAMRRNQRANQQSYTSQAVTA
jgi:hypothetical protein